jgi:hypothetical protein
MLAGMDANSTFPTSPDLMTATDTGRESDLPAFRNQTVRLMITNTATASDLRIDICPTV